MSETKSTLIFPIPSAPLVDERRQVTPAWFRFFISILQRTGGVAGRETPLPPEPFQVGLFEFGTGSGGGSELGLDALQLALPLPTPPVDAFQTFLLPALDGATTNTFDDLHYLALQQGIVEQTAGLNLAGQQEEQVVNPVLLPAPISVPAVPEGITVGASPYSFSPGFDGFAVVSGGTVTGITVSRDNGATTFATGVLAGLFPLSLMDTLILTYTVAPTLTFFRRG